MAFYLLHNYMDFILISEYERYNEIKLKLYFVKYVFYSILILWKGYGYESEF